MVEFKISNQNLVGVVILDPSVFTRVQWRILTISNINRKEHFLGLINEMNCKWKPFKFMMNDDYEVILDISIPCTDANFDPEMVTSLLVHASRALQDGDFAKFMRLQWS